MTDNISREELRKRLRNKIKNKRNSSEVSQQIKKDPQTALMSLGIDDPNILKNAKHIVQNPTEFLKSINSKNENDSEEEEELPPEQC